MLLMSIVTFLICVQINNYLISPKKTARQRTGRSFLRKQLPVDRLSGHAVACDNDPRPFNDLPKAYWHGYSVAIRRIGDYF